jgi:hypothetical protein
MAGWSNTELISQFLFYSCSSVRMSLTTAFALRYIFLDVRRLPRCWSTCFVVGFTCVGIMQANQVLLVDLYPERGASITANVCWLTPYFRAKFNTDNWLWYSHYSGEHIVRTAEQPCQYCVPMSLSKVWLSDLMVQNSTSLVSMLGRSGWPGSHQPYHGCD